MHVRYLVVLLALTLPAAAQDRAAGVQTATARAQHLKRGINASEWFAQSARDYSAARTNRYIDDADIALMAQLGFDSVRLSIDPVPLEQYPRGADGLNGEFVARLDHAVDTMLAAGLAVQIDLHPEENYKLQLRSGNDQIDRMTSLWRRLAAHYASRDTDRIFFEILNEPEVGDAYRWAGIQARVAAAIREVAPKNTLIATGPNFSDIQDLLTQHPLADGSYTHGIPYPATEGSMAELLKELPEAANRFDLERYWLDHWDAHRIRLLIDEAAAWGHSNNVPLLCNEFGAYRQFTEAPSRMNWLHEVRTALEADGIGWTMWDYRGGFGVVFKEDGKPARVDGDVVDALGMKK